MDLDNFPVLVSLSTASNVDFAKVEPDGADIRFTDSDGTTPLKYEIEDWNDGAETAKVWVKVPRINSAVNTDYIYIYYDNPGETDGQDPTGVWDSNYKAVWHMYDSPGGPIIFQDGFEGSGATWDDKWENNGVTSWTQASDQVQAGSFSAKATNGSEGVFTSNDIDASSAASFTVDFWFRKRNIETTDFTLYYFDGTSYDLIVELDSQGAHDIWLHYKTVVTDSQYLISTFRIRFDATLAGGEDVWVDGLQVVDGPVAGDVVYSGESEQLNRAK